MEFEEIKQKKKEARKHSLKDAVFVSGSSGFGDNYISAYGIALGATPGQIGLLTSIPNLIGPLFQALTSKLMLKYSRKKIFSLASFFQSLVWIPIILLFLFFAKDLKQAPIFLIIFYTIYSAFANLSGPAWASWIGDLVKTKEIGKFFGKRNSIANISALIAMIFAGLILDFFKRELFFKGEAFLFFGFSIIFMLALIFRLISRYFVLLQYEPKFRFQKINYFSFWGFVKSAPKRIFGRFAISISLFLLATNIAAPF